MGGRVLVTRITSLSSSVLLPGPGLWRVILAADCVCRGA